MGILSFKSCLILGLVVLALLDLSQVEGRKRKQNRDRQELDDFSGDSYSEFVDKFYRNSQTASSESSPKKKGGNSRYNI